MAFRDNISGEEFTQIVNRSMSERALQAQCLGALNSLGWRVHHIFEQAQYARRTDRGFPDICATKDGRIIYAELKSERGKLTEDQKLWLNDLAKNIGAEVYVVRPSTRQEFYECFASSGRSLNVAHIAWKGGEP